MSLGERSPFLEMNCLTPGEATTGEMLMGMPGDLISLVAAAPKDKVRVIKTHMPFEFLPPNLLDVAKGTCCTGHHMNIVSIVSINS